MAAVDHPATLEQDDQLGHLDSKQRRASARNSGTASRGFMGTAKTWVARCMPASRARSARTLAKARVAKCSIPSGTMNIAASRDQA